MFRKPLFWIVFAAISIGAALYTARKFADAFPLVSIDFKMDRQSALTSARALSGKYAWPPADFHQAVASRSNPEVQSFIELEGGGKQELARILDQQLFSPYTWEVRHYREGETRETRIRFTPDGKPYGFQVKLPEQEAGASLDRDEALAIAERRASEDWNVDLTNYALAEASQEIQPGGRKDHRFVYERQDIRVGEGRYRLRLVVGGDRLSELTHFIQVPEAFSRRYEKMSSINLAIGGFDTAVLFAFYLLGGCGVGLFFLMRQRWVIWRPPVMWSVFICLLVGVDLLNSWPRLWMDYDTALSASGFAMQRIVIGLLTVGMMVILLSLSLMAAESLTRKTFPNQVQLWKVWSAPVASSREILGQISGGYLLVSVFFAYEVLLYAFATSKLGWWFPSDSLTNPDLFGSYIPALSAVANSLQAGFWEECLFRAVPLACAAWIGTRFGYRRTMIVIAMVVQAVVFGAGHAPYPNQPAYARLVELMIPSFAFGALYLRFGLLPGIILHYAYDVVWMAMPIFMSSGPRARVEQVLVVLLAFVPLGISLIARARTGAWGEVPEEARNRAWTPRVAEAREPAVTVVPETSVLSPLVARVLPIVGAVSLIAWFGLADFKSDAPPVTLSRSEAEAIARQALADRGINLDPSWKVLSRTQTGPGDGHRFVWRTAGHDQYDRLLGTYLSVPQWYVRFARFEGDVAERAEEYQVTVADRPRLVRVRHQFAEAAPGKTLAEDEARVIAQSAAMAAMKIPPDALREISAEAEKRPMRTDWTFQFADTREKAIGEGQARIAVVVAGDQVADVTPYVFVPEAWTRNERARQNLPDILNILCIILLAPFILAGVVGAVLHWTRKRQFSVAGFSLFFAVLFVLYGGSLMNNWPVTVSQLPTAQPFWLEATVTSVVTLVLVLILSTGLGLLGGSAIGSMEAKSTISFPRAILLGASLGVLIVALTEVARKFSSSSTDPQWVGFGGIAVFFPLLAGAITPLNAFLTRTLILVVLLQQIRWLASRWGGRWHTYLALFLLLGLIGTGLGSVESVSSWLISGLITGVVLTGSYLFVLRHASAIIPLAFGTMTILTTLAQGAARSYPAALPGAVVGATLVLLVCLIWARATSVNQIDSSPV